MHGMIGGLRRKFVLINMALVALVLAVTFGAQLVSAQQRLANESYDSLRRAVSREAGAPADRFQFGAPDGPHGDKLPLPPAAPVFTVSVGADGAILDTNSENAEVTDEVAQEAAAQALAAGGERGTLHGLGLRYLVRELPNGGAKLAFADMTAERRSLAAQALTALTAGLGALAALLLVSLFLSRWALRPAARAWEQQRQFVADASHELKTPLTVILANTGILLSHPQDTIAAQRKWIEHTRDEAGRMKGLVEDLLFLARADAAPQRLPSMPFDLSDAALGCVLPFEPVAFERGVTLESDIEPKLTVTGDEAQLRQLIGILLDNACKYAGAHGEVRISLAGAGDKAVLRVMNTGKPIPPEAQARLFERFYRADSARARGREDAGGYGLGLAIAERIVRTHRGKITVQSNAQQGTVFTVTLPRQTKA